MTMTKIVNGVEVELTPEEEAAVLAERAASTPPPTLAERKAAASADADARRLQVLEAGFTVPSGPLAGHVLQFRNDSDRVKWLVSASKYGNAVGGGQGNQSAARFRGADNSTLVVTNKQGHDALQSLFAWAGAVDARAWALKDAIEAAADGLSVEQTRSSIPFGWP